ncbi:MAG: GWxTD domain-containing protein [Bacteroidales bacterium]|nr:GWxTD domain-containing protein [Bacteroidales bacterium]
MRTYLFRNISFVFFILIICLCSCKLQQTTSYTKRLNLSFLYNPNLQTLKAKVVVFNSTDSISTVYCSIPVQSLQFNRNDTIELATLSVHYKLFKTSAGLQLKDSATFIKTINKRDFINQNYFHFPVNISDTGMFMIDLFILDKYSYFSYHNYVTLEKRKKYSDNDFLIVNKNNHPYFDCWLQEQDTFLIRTRQNMPIEWKMAWFSNTFKNAMPPYSMSSNKDDVITNPDSIRIFLICDTCCFIASRKGILHIYRDSIGNGKTIFIFSNDYPKMTRPSELLKPIRMLTSQKEFNELNVLADKKEAVDKFWLNAAGNTERARELIRVFYTRVNLANQYFTSYTEGWKTDRGMIYIIFGLPTTIYKAPNVEQWIYGTPESAKTLVFSFIKKYHPFSNNHFVLERNENFKISWLQAVDTWRNGRIFSIAN